MVAVAQPNPERSRVLSTALIEAAKRLDLGSTDLQYILGISQPTASRLLRGAFSIVEGSKTWELGAHLVRLYRSLVWHLALCSGDWLAPESVAASPRTKATGATKQRQCDTPEPSPLGPGDA